MTLAGANPAGLAPRTACAAAQHHATVVVSHLDPKMPTLRVCVPFDEAQISGHELLHRSGVEVGFSSTYGGEGSAVCQVDNEPASYPPDCLNTSGPYWSVWTASYHGAWSYSRSSGVDRVTIRDGDSEGFRYASPSGQAPPASPADTCPPPVAPSVSPAPSATAVSTAPARTPTGGPVGATASSPAATGTPSTVASVPAAPDSPKLEPGVSPPPHSPAGRAPVTGSPPSGGWAGPAAAALAGVLLVGGLGAQLLLPRLRR